MITKFALSLIAGCVFGYAYNNVNWLLAILAIAAFIRVMNGNSTWQRVCFAATFFAVYWLNVISWIRVLGIVPLVLLTLVCAIPYLFVAFIPSSQTYSFAAAWVLAEFIHAEFPWEGFPWGLAAYTQTNGPLVEVARFGGQYLTSFVVLVAAGCVARFWRFASFTTFGLIAAVVVVIHFIVPTQDIQGSLKVAAIQGNVPRLGYDYETQRRAVLNNHVQTTREFLASKTENVSLVVWPENAVDNDPINTGYVNLRVNALSKQMSMPLLVGGLVATGNGDDEHNAGILWRNGEAGQQYAKHQLVPFGEYIPTGNFLRSWVEAQFPYVPRMVPGTANGIFTLDNGISFGDVICFEIANENFVRERIHDGAQFIAVQTNNATYANTSQPQQQLNITRFRAIENQRDIVVAATTGHTVIVNSAGVVVEEAVPQQSEFIVGDVQLRTQREHTLSTHWQILFCLILTFMGVRKRQTLN